MEQNHPCDCYECLNKLLMYCVYCYSADDVPMLTTPVQCYEDLGKTKGRLSATAPVFYACGSRLFKSQAIVDFSLGDNGVISYNADQFSSAENSSGNGIGRLPVTDDRICPFCRLLIAGSLSPTEYERHIQSHLDSDADDDIDDDDVVI